MGQAGWQDLAALAAQVHSGCLLAVPKDSSGVSMAITREILRSGVRDLHLVCLPTSGLQAEVLIGAGAVRTLETSAVSLGEFGPAPRFAAAVRAGTIRLLDATCPALYAAFQAGQKGLPFIPLRGLIGSDLLRMRADWKVIDNPFAPGDAIALLPAIRPDVCVFHAPLADAEGNVFIGRERDLLLLAQASRRCLVSVEAVSKENLLRDPARAGSVIPAIYVNGLARAPGGAQPLELEGHHETDAAQMSAYVSRSSTEAGFRAFLDEWLSLGKVAA